MKSLLLAASTVLVLSFVASDQALAQHCGSYYGYGGHGSPGLSVSIGYGGFSGYNRGYSSINSGYFAHGHSGYGGHSGYQSVPVYSGHSHRIWHDTTHLDYHGPSLIRHRGHYDYVPGHYDAHQTGHWDHHGSW